MSALSVHLLGTFRIRHKGQEVQPVQPCKARELLCYLLLHRNKPHSRELLASVFWPECTTAQSRKYLRQTLWQLHQSLPAPPEAGAKWILLSDSDSVQINTEADIWLDVRELENAYDPVRLLTGEELDGVRADALRAAVSLYAGDLLEGWYQDWCLYERERLQNIYLMALEKLMAYSEIHQDFESGLNYGELILKHDRARERTYAKLMRLHYFMGDRAGAVRQFQRCIVALDRELDVAPSKKTVELYEQIRADRLVTPLIVSPNVEFSQETPSSSPLASVVQHLQRIHSLLIHLRQCVQQDLDLVDQILSMPAAHDSNADFATTKIFKT